MSALLQLDGVTVRFGGLTALSDVSFTVASNRITALIGPNGAGKTTCFNVISGFQPPTAGRVAFDGDDITDVPAHRRDGMGRTFQLVELCEDLTVRDNVKLGFHRALRGGMLATGLRRPGIAAQERRVTEEADQLLETVGLTAVASRPAGSLPLGQQRLVELARALARRPRLILLDESASGLDQGELEEFTARISSLRESGMTVLLVEHNLKFVRTLADDMVVLNFGEVIFEGPMDEGFEAPQVADAYLLGGATHA